MRDHRVLPRVSHAMSGMHGTPGSTPVSSIAALDDATARALHGPQLYRYAAAEGSPVPGGTKQRKAHGLRAAVDGPIPTRATFTLS